MFDIFVEVSVMEFVKLCLVFVVTAVEASDARMKRVLNNEAWVRLPVKGNAGWSSGRMNEAYLSKREGVVHLYTPQQLPACRRRLDLLS